ncbi:hypothetical protein ACL02R_20055 [Streptomyces sp. MS19]|uniref:hypothetical protein n=1 Tax=Streptomyces sp. MS19 TaxID=3385972 RepID=UPI0039A28321
MTRPVHGEPGRFPPRHRVRPDERHLRDGRYAWRRVPLDDLHLAAMANAYPHGRWPGGSSTRPLRVRRGPRSSCGGSANWPYAAVADRKVSQHTPPRAAREGVPLRMARRGAPGPAGPVVVTLDRVPVARLRTRLAAGRTLTPGTARASLVPLPDRYGPPPIAVIAPGRYWTLRRTAPRSSAPRRDVAPPAPSGGRRLLRPLTPVRSETGATGEEAVDRAAGEAAGSPLGWLGA